MNETKNIHFDENREIVSDSGSLSADLPVSMNIWGFHPNGIGKIEAYFEDFLKKMDADDIKSECLLPVMINDFLRDGKITVRAKSSKDCWFGLTYKEDVAVTQAALRELHERGLYPNRLF